MWKYMSRRIRDSFERSANYFDVRSTTGLTNAPNNNFNVSEKEKSSTPDCWFCPRNCWNSFRGNNNTNNNRWNFEHLNYTWLGAITWSSGLVIAWYASQLLHLKSKYKKAHDKKTKFCDLYLSLRPHFKNSQFSLQSSTRIEEAIRKLSPAIQLVTNDHKECADRRRVASGSSTSAESSGSDLGDVLNSIENRLGLSAIENGQHQEGLNLLRSAAHRKHAPALYNLGLCYELGLGVKPDEKMAMELYRSAASLEHPGALYNLSIYYGQGRGGLSRDTNTATRLLRLAAVKGQEDAIKALKNLDIPSIEEKKPLEAWPYNSLSRLDSVAPMQSSLFVDSKQFMHVCHYGATVY